MEPFAHEELERFRGLLGIRLGLQFDDSRRDLLADVLRQRLVARGRMGVERYLAGLAAAVEREELRTLAAMLTVTETYFFRAPEHFRALAEVAVPERLRATPPARPLRILSAGCASGDEAYSAAMVLRERFPELPRSYILGIDLNPAMLAKATEARYGPWSLREIPEELRERYFAPEGRQFVLDPAIRRMAAFEERNLGVEDGNPWSFEPFDIIFCRNTIMYMVAEASRLAVARITRALAPAGFLFLSHAETLRGLSQDFHLRHTHDTFYYQKRGAGALEERAHSRAAVQYPAEPADLSWVDSIRLASEQIDSLSRDGGEGSRPASAPKSSAGDRAASGQLGRALDLLRQERFREALETVGELPADPDARLLRAALLTNCGEVAAAQAVCEQLLASDDLNASAQYLTALCREHAGDFQGAVEHDRAAIYLDPTFAMPHLHLGLLAKRSGDWAAARSEMERARSLLEREDASRILLLGGGFSRQALLEFSRAELQACGGHA
jgi:chemotaxis protein methyltransferase CheR